MSMVEFLLRFHGNQGTHKNLKKMFLVIEEDAN